MYASYSRNRCQLSSYLEEFKHEIAKADQLRRILCAQKVKILIWNGTVIL